MHNFSKEQQSKIIKEAFQPLLNLLLEEVEPGKRKRPLGDKQHSDLSRKRDNEELQAALTDMFDMLAKRDELKNGKRLGSSVYVEGPPSAGNNPGYREALPESVDADLTPTKYAPPPVYEAIPGRTSGSSESASPSVPDSKKLNNKSFLHLFEKRKRHSLGSGKPRKQSENNKKSRPK